MKQALTLAAGAAVIIGGMTYQALNLGAADKVKICHRTGNGNAHVIEISEHAVPAHLNHGDSLDAADGHENGDACLIPSDEGGDGGDVEK
jgi:hypothetical protein